MTDLDRLYDLLTIGSTVIRTRNPDLEREAAERAREARDQVGLVADGDDGIPHPTQTEREARLGPDWTGKGVAEIATWNYLYNDPIKAAADGLLGSPVHRAILDDPTFMYWGAGIYTELPEGEPELARRYYVVIWVSKLIPPENPRFPDVPFDHPRHDDIEFLAERGIITGYGDGTYKPDQPVTRGELAAFIARTIRQFGP